ncbi:MAG TPA: type II toxin-antitoxin system prevent-host-death family antitoxin [Steroidobacteraceae bacterium]
MQTTVSKSRFKAQALELFRQVERSGKPITITDRGKPVLLLVPWRDDPESAVRMLRETVVKYRAPTRPVGDDEWESGA